MKNRGMRAARPLSRSFPSRFVHAPLMLAMLAGAALSPLALADEQPDSPQARAEAAAARAEAAAAKAAQAAAAAEAARVEALEARAQAAEANAAMARAEADLARAAAARTGIVIPERQAPVAVPPVPVTPAAPAPAGTTTNTAPGSAYATPGSASSPFASLRPATPASAPIPANLPPGWYPVTSIDLQYGADPQPISLARLRETIVTLGVAYGGGLTGLEERSRSIDLPLSQIGSGEFNRIDAAGIRVITQTLIREFENSGVLGVAALPDPDQIEVVGPPTDLRKPGDTTLRLYLFVGVVREIRSVAVEANDPESRRVNPDTAFHQRLRANAPVRRGDVINREKLDEYVARSSRHPGRRVDVAISASGEEQGGATLDFVVSEAKPWLVYLQVSNTGTEETDTWRERLGFLHTNLTGADDILQVDYITAGFTDSHSVTASYDFRIIDRLRMKVYTGFNIFTASDVGQQEFKFDGTGFNIGAEVAYEMAYLHGFFIDTIGGLRYEYVSTDRSLPGPDQSGKGSFLIPYVGVKAERRTDASSFNGSLIFEYYGGLGNDDTDLVELGRLDPDKSWPLFKYDLGGSFYIEPLLFPQQFEQGQGGTGAMLANEFYFNLRGQYAFDSRVIPTVEQTLGGFSSVRGYPESLLAGDSSILATAEYRLHIPPLFGYSGPADKSEQSDFRFRPTEPWGSADWDLIFRGFLDVGRVVNSDRKIFERDTTLVGAGVGLELQILRYLNARVDWGFALQHVDTTTDSVDVGDNRLHFVLTVSF